MNRFVRLSLSTQALLLGCLGVLLNFGIARLPDHPLVLACRTVINLGGELFSAWLRGLAVPVVLSSLILGAVGLEPMRAVGKLCLRTLGWMVAAASTAALVGVSTACALFPSRGITSWSIYTLPSVRPCLEIPAASWLWTMVVLLGLSFSYYRNQIDESQGRLISRLCLAAEGMLNPMLALTTRLLPWGILASLLSVKTHAAPAHPLESVALLTVIGHGEQSTLLMWYALKSLVLAWLIFASVVLPVTLWCLTKINPWNYLRAMLPPMLAALATGEVVEALPVTLHFARHGAHVSNRVASVSASLCATFQREGLILGLTTLAACYWKLHGDAWSWLGAATIVLMGTIAAVGTSAVPLSTNPALLFLCGMLGTGEDWPVRGWLIWAVVSRVGAAISVWSHACILAIIARAEGEYWVPGPPPDPDELQGLKNDLALADN